MDGKIALEEHWAIDQALDIAPRFGTADWRLSVDSRDRRLSDMDKNGIELAILGLNSPALQGILDPAEAADVARQANNTLADEIARNPRRFAGFAGLPMQNPEEAARELTRCVTELGFKARWSIASRRERYPIRLSTSIFRNFGRFGGEWPNSTCRSISIRG